MLLPRLVTYTITSYITYQKRSAYIPITNHGWVKSWNTVSMKRRQTKSKRKKELRVKAKTSSGEYRNKVEKWLSGGNTREALRGLITMMGREQKKTQKVKCADPLMFVNELITFYAQFHMRDFSWEVDNDCCSLLTATVTVCKGDVIRILSHVNPYKTSRPDNVRDMVLKEC